MIQRKCPQCGAKPLLDGLQSIVTAVLVMAIVMALDLWRNRSKKTFDGTSYFLIFGTVVVVMLFPLKVAFQKLRRGRW